MSKVGRNDPCPCGSGKKYKKCCLAKDEKQRNEDTRRDDMRALFEDLPSVDDPLDETDETEDWEESSAIDSEPYVSKTISDDVPQISDRENALVEAWWSQYQELKDPDEILRHLHAFFETHPDLVENLELHHEVLFELGAELVGRGRVGDYIALLKHVRETFPAAYLKSFTYYDRDIIAYTVIEQGRDADIHVYLEWFKEYPDADADNLFKVIELLMASECDAPLMGLLEATYEPLIRSPHVIGGGEALDILIYAYCGDCLDRGADRAALDALLERLEALRIPLRDQWYDRKWLEETLNQIAGDLDAGFLDSFRTTRDVARYYDIATLNFMGWLHREKGFSWMKAWFYHQQALRYLCNSIPSGKRPRQPFTFTRQLVDQTLAGNALLFFSLDATKALGSINAMYWFAEYLGERDLISARLGADLQRWCEELWQSASAGLRQQGIEGGVFKVFPS